MMITGIRGDQLMTDLTEDDYQLLFARVAEQVTTCCRRKFPALRDARYEAMHLAVDALAYSWQPDLTARQWLAMVGEHLGIDATECLNAVEIGW
jgi:hypothetical protein